MHDRAACQSSIHSRLKFPDRGSSLGSGSAADRRAEPFRPGNSDPDRHFRMARLKKRGDAFRSPPAISGVPERPKHGSPTPRPPKPSDSGDFTATEPRLRRARCKEAAWKSAGPCNHHHASSKEVPREPDVKSLGRETRPSLSAWGCLPEGKGRQAAVVPSRRHRFGIGHRPCYPGPPADGKCVEQ